MKGVTKKLFIILLTAIVVICSGGCLNEYFYRYDDGGKQVVAVELLQYCTKDGLESEDMPQEAICIKNRYFQLVESLENEWLDDYVTDLKQQEEYKTTYLHTYEDTYEDEYHPLRQCVRVSYADGSFFLMSWGKELNRAYGSIAEFDENGDLMRAYALDGKYNHYMFVAANYFDARIVVAGENEEVTS